RHRGHAVPSREISYLDVDVLTIVGVQQIAQDFSHEGPRLYGRTTGNRTVRFGAPQQIVEEVIHRPRIRLDTGEIMPQGRALGAIEAFECEPREAGEGSDRRLEIVRDGVGKSLQLGVRGVKLGIGGAQLAAPALLPDRAPSDATAEDPIEVGD